MSKILDILLGKTSTDIIGAVSKGVDELILTKEEKAELEAKSDEREFRARELDNDQLNKELAFHIEATKLDLDNTKSARETEVAVLNSTKANWINVNIRPLLGITVLVVSFIFFFLLVFRKSSLTGIGENILFTILGAVIGNLNTILNYYFGSSSSSSEKNDIIKTLKDERPSR
jgi:VIT1/CCC1 family predicted Fe2+/Mn2+ transporter